MADAGSTRQSPQMEVALTAALLIIVGIVFAVAFVATSTPDATTSSSIDTQSYATEAAAVLVGASASEGEALIEANQCGACHVSGAGRVAPTFVGVADRALTRQPPMTAVQYLYESIVAPGAYLVEGYANAMPANFAGRLTQAEIGHIIAYLLSTPGGDVQHSSS